MTTMKIKMPVSMALVLMCGKLEVTVQRGFGSVKLLLDRWPWYRAL